MIRMALCNIALETIQAWRNLFWDKCQVLKIMYLPRQMTRNMKFSSTSFFFQPLMFHLSRGRRRYSPKLGPYVKTRRSKEKKLSFDSNYDHVWQENLNS